MAALLLAGGLWEGYLNFAFPSTNRGDAIAAGLKAGWFALSPALAGAYALARGGSGRRTAVAVVIAGVVAPLLVVVAIAIVLLIAVAQCPPDASECF